MYDENGGEYTPNIATVSILINDDEDDGNGNGANDGEYLVNQKRYRVSVSSTTFADVLSGGEGSSGGRVMKRSLSLDPSTFQLVSHSLGIDNPSSYIQQLK